MMTVCAQDILYNLPCSICVLNFDSVVVQYSINSCDEIYNGCDANHDVICEIINSYYKFWASWGSTGM